MDKYKIYRNLHKKCFSVLKYSSDKKGYRLHAHVESFICRQAELKVSEAGRQRVILEGQKNVHAYIICKEYRELGLNEIHDIWIKSEECTKKLGQLYYNPYTTKTFQIEETGEAVFNSENILGFGGKVYTGGNVIRELKSINIL